MMRKKYGPPVVIVVVVLFISFAVAALTADALLHHILQSHRRHAFAPRHPPPRVGSRHEQHVIHTSSLQMAGFGGASTKKGSKKNKKDMNLKLLKPKQQWDRYRSDALKGFNCIPVAVRVVSTTNECTWLEVGAVKSKENAYTEAAVIRHRVLIADHARRMFPLQVLAKDRLEWGYSTAAAHITTREEEDVVEWTVAGKVDNMPGDIDKQIGFQGLPEPTGFYAHSESKGLGNTTTQADFESIMTKRIV